MTLKVCFSTLACPDWSWHDVLKYGPEFGFDGVEIRLLSRETNLLNIEDLHPRHWPQRRRELADAGFSVAGLASSVRFDSTDEVDRRNQFETGCRYVDLCAALGGSFIRVFGDVLPQDNPSARTRAIEQIAEGIVTLGDYASRQNQQILLETHGDFSASAPCVEVMRLADHPSVGLVWDTHHPWRFHGELLAETWKQLRPWVKHLHWKDSVILPTHANTAETEAAANAASQLMGGHQHADYVLFGGGQFPVVNCLSLLLADNYDGWHSLEWEKMWHPELVGPEVALPLFPPKLKELEPLARLISSTRQ